VRRVIAFWIATGLSPAASMSGCENGVTCAAKPSSASFLSK
jgi:hypothetical protein